MSDASGTGAWPASETAVRYLLHTAHRRLDMEAAFLAELTETERIYRATAGTSETFTVFDGGRLPRLEGYCQRVMESDSPWVIRDTHQEPAVRELDVTEAGRFGAYIGVPVRLPDGRPFGTLCCVHHTPREDLGDNEVSVLEALADILGFHIDQLAGREEHIDDLETYVDDLADRLGEHELRLEAFRHLADVSLNATLLVRPDSFHIEYANLAAAELVGADPSALIGTLPWEHHACWSEVTLRPLLEALAGGRSRPVRYQQDPVDGAPAMDIQIQRFSTEGGTDFLLWKGHDVTIHRESTRRLQAALELEREASDQLRTVDAQRSAFLTAVSHELRTPLTIVRGRPRRCGRVGWKAMLARRCSTGSMPTRGGSTGC